MARNFLQIGYDDGNALSGAPYAIPDPTDPMAYAGVQNAVRVVDPLTQWLASMRAKSDARGVTPVWNVNNPVGTETLLPQQSMRMPDPSFRPGVFAGGGTVPMSAEQIDAFRAGSQDAYDQLSLIGGLPGAGVRLPGAPTAEGRVRPPRNPLPRRVAARLTDVPEYAPGEPPYAPPGEPYTPAAEGVPVPGIGSNKAPTRSAIWANPVTRRAAVAERGRMGSNADTTLADLGLPAYEDIVRSTRTTPMTEAEIRSGAEHVVKPTNVFDLSDTWRVPNVPQTDLPSIDPDAGRRKGLPDHVLNATNDPAMKEKMRMIAEAGLRVGGAYWYNAEPLRLAFVTEHGPEEGNAIFEKYMRTVGAVSAGSDVGQNIRTGSYYNVRERQGRPVQGALDEKGRWVPADLESPYGHKLQGTQYRAYRDIQGGNPLDPEERPKRARFDANLGGNQKPVTVDKHNMRLIGMLSRDPEFLNTQIEADVNYPSLGIKEGDKINFREAFKNGRFTMDQLIEVPAAWKDVPETQHYGALERFQQELATEMGISPAQLQAALWVGGGRVTGLRSLPTSFMGAFEQRLQKTAAERGGTPQKALLDFVRGKKPLLTPLAGTIGAGAAANALDRRDEDR